jgi:hypothetical protein
VDLTRAELRHIVWQQLGIRVSPAATVEQMQDLLSYKLYGRDLPSNPVNALRDKIVAYIQENRDRLSLPCDGNCYNHPDGMVLNCNETFKEK